MREYRLDCDRVAVIGIFSKISNVLLKFWLGIHPDLSINLLSSFFCDWLLFRFFYFFCFFGYCKLTMPV